MVGRKLAPIRAGSLRQQVQERVFEAILAGDFLPGAPLRELDLARDLRAMKPTAYLVNTSRGPIIEAAALLRALNEGWIAGAGLE